MSFKVHFRWGNLDLCSGVIAVPIGPNSHTFTVILAVFAPQPRWPRKPWKGPLIIYATQQWKKKSECNNTLTFIHLYLAANKVNREFEFATKNRMKFLRFLKNTSALAISLPLYSLATPQINSPKGNFSTIQHRFCNLSYIKRLLLPDVNLGSNPSIFIHL